MIASSHVAAESDELPFCPIDFHCHGVGKFDFTEVPELSLDAVEQSLRRERVRSILTLYLPRRHYDDFLGLIDAFDRGRRDGRYRYIVGIALEGPLLASHGGTPEQGVWTPTRTQWQRLAAGGSRGLAYVVVSADARCGDDADSPPDVAWIFDCLLAGGVRPALGHFRKDAPEDCAARIRALLALVDRSGRGPIVTDHLYNDMPLNFCHAWRTARSRARRAEELAALDLSSWTSTDILERVGPVPAALLQGARDGLVKLCLNFDGEHVDLAISKRTVELMGSDLFMLMTDRIQSKVLGGQLLHQRNDSTLLYQDRGIVAGGSQALAQQIHNMRMCGFAEADIRRIACEVPAGVLGLPVALDGGVAAWIPESAA